MKEEKYSVLMSVYYKEKPEYLLESMESILNQTVPTNDFVLVCDGPLNQELDKVIQEMQGKFREVLHIVRLKENSGLGNALNEGLKYCKNELVARMDSDDISFRERCELELKCFEKQPDLDIVGGTILEFENSIDVITGKRLVPETQKAICKFSRKRNPFNHPSVMFKKSEVERVGGYSEAYPLFEDYYLWIRMLKNGSVGLNIQNPVLYMRTSVDMYLRRGGLVYAGNLLKFYGWLLSIGWCGVIDYISSAIPHALVCVLPNCLRKQVYKLLH